MMDMKPPSYASKVKPVWTFEGWDSWKNRLIALTNPENGVFIAIGA
jgi:hypothetical protein